MLFVLLFAALLGLKALGISQGWPTRLLPFVAMIAVALLCTQRADSGRFAKLKLHLSRKSGIAAILLLASATLPLLVGFVFEASLKPTQSYELGIASAIVYYALVAFSEELFFRGCLGSILQKKGLLVKIIVSSATFAGFHFLSPEFGLETFLLIFVIGLFLMYVFDRLDSLWPVVAFHWAWNILADHFSAYDNPLYMLSSLVIVTILVTVLTKKK